MCLGTTGKFNVCEIIKKKINKKFDRIFLNQGQEQAYYLHKTQYMGSKLQLINLNRI